MTTQHKAYNARDYIPCVLWEQGILVSIYSNICLLIIVMIISFVPRGTIRIDILNIVSRETFIYTIYAIINILIFFVPQNNAKNGIFLILTLYIKP
jgi:hypothetical protein